MKPSCDILPAMPILLIGFRVAMFPSSLSTISLQQEPYREYLWTLPTASVENREYVFVSP